MMRKNDNERALIAFASIDCGCADQVGVAIHLLSSMSSQVPTRSKL